MAAAAPSRFKTHRRQVWNSVFPEPSKPTPHIPPTSNFSSHGQSFFDPGSVHSPPPSRYGPGQLRTSPRRRAARDSAATAAAAAAASVGLGLGLGGVHLGSGPHLSSAAVDDQITYDRAWHVVTSRVALPSTVTAEDSFGSLLPESQLPSSQDLSAEADFKAALHLVLSAKTMLPHASHTEDVLLWHSQQVRQHFAQHVVPMLSACAVPENAAASPLPDRASRFDQHMSAITNSIRTIEAAFRQYDYGLHLILRGYHRLAHHGASEVPAPDVDMDDSSATTADVEALARRFHKDVRSLVGNSVPEGLLASLRVVLTSLISRILGFGHERSRLEEASAPAASSGPGRPPRPTGTSAPPRPAPPEEDDLQSAAARQRLHELVGSLAEVGLAGEPTQILLAEVMDKLMSEFVSGAFAGTWTTTSSTTSTTSTTIGDGTQEKPNTCSSMLNHWVENHFARTALEVLRLMKAEDDEGMDEAADAGVPAVSFADVTKWKDIAFGRLAALRISELFDIVLDWPRSKSGLEDLRASVATPQRRLQLSDSFSAALENRLLHSSRSTLEILRVYIAMIRSFHVLDHSKVLLGRVVPSLQMYLCQREDAIRLVVTGLLANPDEARQGDESLPSSVGPAPAALSKDTSGIVGPNSSSLVELAALLNDPSQQRRQPHEDDDMDWNDMDWVPDPVDAGVNYKRPKSEDVVGTLINALGAEEVFIKEFQNIIAERLLSSQRRFDQEIKVLQLLKKRFGEGALQSCDVMIKDIKDSGRLDPYVRRTQFVAEFRTPRAESDASAAAAQGPGDVRYSARILSRLFWPAMAREHFLLPAPVADKQRQYGDEYERIKSSRKLTWLDHLGQATVELELRDRTVSVECRTWEAAVIYAFQEDEEEQRGHEAQRSVEDLYMTLQMDEDLIVQALDFWAGQRVLRRVNADTYAVMETLPPTARAGGDGGGGGGDHDDNDDDDDVASGGGGGGGDDEKTPAEAAAAAALRRNRVGTGAAAAAAAVDAQAQQQRTVCWQFIVGMLTNSAASMPLAQIAMMMKMMMAGGFPWTDEELQEFLAHKVAEGALEVVGGKYKLVKK